MRDQAQLLLLTFPEKLQFFPEAFALCRKNGTIAILPLISLWDGDSFHGQCSTGGIYLLLGH